MREFTVSGTPYEMGVQTAGHFLPYLETVRGRYEEKIGIPSVRETVLRLKEKLLAAYPDAYEEIRGRAAGSGMSEDAAFLMFFPEIFKRIDGCTTVMLRRTDGAFLMAHNEDDPAYDHGNTALVTYDYGDHEVVGFTMAEKLTGYAFGWNSYGLVYSSNYVYDTKIDLDQVSRYIMVRDIMNAKTIEEAIYRLGRMQVASAFSLNIYDRNRKIGASVEKDTDAIYVTEVRERYGRANHFTTRRDALLPEHPAGSVFRDEKVNELIRELPLDSASITDLQTILDYAGEDFFHSVFKDPLRYDYKNKSCTVATFSYDGVNDRIMIRDSFDRSLLVFRPLPDGRWVHEV